MTSASGAYLAGLRRHSRIIIWTLVAVAIVLRALLAIDSPTPFGYVFDYYHEAIQLFYEKGRLPIAADCWQCYHPPLYYLLGLPFYSVGAWLAGWSEDADAADWGLRALTLLALIAGAIATYCSARLVQFLARDRALTVIGAALVLTFPCLFISSYGPDADIIVTAAMTAFLLAFTKFAAASDRQSWKSAAWIGALAGLAASAKYSGLIALATAGVVLAIRLVIARDRMRTITNGVIIAAVAILIASPKYVDNWRRHGTPLFANGSAGDAFSSTRQYYWDEYDFFSFSPTAILDASGPHAPAGELTDLPVYHSVWTTLYGLAWTDLSFFSVRGRISDPNPPYPAKNIPRAVTASVLYLGLVPTLLAVVGFFVTVLRREYLPLTVMLVLTLASYLAWVVAQDAWALKTKYIQFLLPVFVAYVVAGLRFTGRRLPGPLSAGVLLAVGALVVASHVYLLAFAIGHL
jgi:4-amino-4-deoxy-L-arabinose transferase-like glycosyltransferase